MGLNKQSKKGYQGPRFREGLHDKGGTNEPPTTPRPSNPPGATKPQPKAEKSGQAPIVPCPKCNTICQLSGPGPWKCPTCGTPLVSPGAARPKPEKPPPDDQLKRTVALPAIRKTVTTHGMQVVNETKEQGTAWDCPGCKVRCESFAKGLHKHLAFNNDARLQCPQCRNWALVSRNVIEVVSDGAANRLIGQELVAKAAAQSLRAR